MLDGNPDDSFLGKELPLKSRIGITPNESPKSLKVVNCGSGTTGTHSVYDSMCEYNYKSVHFRLSCNYQNDTSPEVKAKRSSLEQWHVKTTRCVLSSSSKQGCETKQILAKLRKALEETLSVVDFITDSPTDVLLSEILAYIPQIKVIGTYRHPGSWAKRRMRTHGTTQLICRPELWSDPSILHPFDIIGCLQVSSAFPKDTLMTLFEYVNGVTFDSYKKLSKKEKIGVTSQRGHDISVVEKAYQQMNTVNLKLIHATDMQYLQLCLWDFPKRNNSVLHISLGEFISQDSPSSIVASNVRQLSQSSDLFWTSCNPNCIRTLLFSKGYLASDSFVDLFCLPYFILFCVILLPCLLRFVPRRAK